MTIRGTITIRVDGQDEQWPIRKEAYRSGLSAVVACRCGREIMAQGFWSHRKSCGACKKVLTQGAA